MTNHSCGRNRQCRTVPVVRSAPPVTAPSEPPVHRWPHPVDGAPSIPPSEPTLHYVRCALSYQNQLLADIKSLLERMAPSLEENSEK